MTIYYRPVPMCDPHRPIDAMTLAGGWCWFTHAERIERGAPSRLVATSDIPQAVLARLTAVRPPIAGLAMDAPKIMGILNVTPDSFSDGGRFETIDAAVSQAHAMIAQGADIIDIGGESTRPGSMSVDVDAEIARIAPVISAIRAGSSVPISIDTRKAPVARAAFEAGGALLNDVSALTYDADMAQVVASAQVPCCLMHALGDPATMQDAPYYDNVTLDVYDFLEARIQVAEAAGIRRDRIVVDPGIGFGKTLEHNLTLLRNLPLFHGLGCAVLLGASRKRFIATLGKAPDVADRMPGSVAIALHGVRQGMQILRVHDTFATRQALSLHLAVN